ncbi:related to serine/threonine-protein kinase [Sporisorium reilianum f. sp. reilianum]|uniref:Related to serine/threonine-protein kinase n=1 Tax=Sporisorium reilianum f. sp. reilianum TaxID=72559 RepID=A0A2N8UCM2_9BASI|nr:related to serine/threonine-protein kinase [Sporisorium reilianum f. sp. reilianum]
MPVLEQFKNFIRHGKAAREAPEGSINDPSAGPSIQVQPAESSFSTKNPSSGFAPQDKASPVPASTSQTHAAAVAAAAAATSSHPASQADQQARDMKQSNGNHLAVPAASSSKGVAANEQYQREAERIVAEEREASEKMPYYEGLSERFQLIKKMGDGAFSNVYKARDRQTGQKVAIKVVRKYELNSNQDRLDPNFRKKNRVTERANILKEVQIMRNLKHDGIVDLLSFSESRDHYFLVLELMEGGELFHQIVKLTYFSEALARHVILQVAHAIRYLHEERGVVHRDIKPENLLFESIKIIASKQPIQRPYDEEKEDEGEFMPGIGGGGIGRVKIADFGLSKVVWEESTMTPCGTVGYTAPEIVKDERYSKSVDMWALGCVLYTLLCGFPPFYDESISVLTEKVAKGYYTFLSPWWDDISASAKDLITHLLCVDPRQRYTIDEFLRHPWCNVKDPIPDLNSADISLAKASEMPLDSPLLASMKTGNAARNNMMSPGINRLKEAFDVTYAVLRMEEEGARKRAGGGNPLGELNEEDESDEADEARRKYGDAAGQAVENQRGARTQNATAAAARTQPSSTQQQYQGRGGADRRLAEAALYDGRAGPRDRGTNSNRKRGFELNMGNATLLGRRNKAGGVGTPRLDNLGNPIVDGAHAAGIVPGSPMRVD